MSLVLFRRPTPLPSTNSAPSLPTSLKSSPPLQKRVQQNIDRFQVLLIQKPETAIFLMNFVEEFYDQNGV